MEKKAESINSKKEKPHRNRQNVIETKDFENNQHLKVIEMKNLPKKKFLEKEDTNSKARLTSVALKSPKKKANENQISSDLNQNQDESDLDLSPLSKVTVPLLKKVFRFNPIYQALDKTPEISLRDSHNEQFPRRTSILKNKLKTESQKTTQNDCELTQNSTKAVLDSYMSTMPDELPEEDSLRIVNEDMPEIDFFGYGETPSRKPDDSKKHEKPVKRIRRLSGILLHRSLSLTDHPKPVPEVPFDKGWAWMILLAAFWVNLMVTGLERSYGIFFDSFKELYGISNAQASLPAAIYGAVCNFLGPLFTALCDTLTCRSVLYVSAVSGFLGFLICHFSTSIGPIVVGHGVFFGFSIGCAYAAGGILLNRYFKVKRSMSQALMMAGGSIGGMVFPLLTETMIKTYTLNGTYLILSAVILNMATCAALSRPLIFYILKEKDYQWQEVLQKLHKKSLNIAPTTIDINGGGVAAKVVEAGDGKESAASRKGLRSASVTTTITDNTDTIRENIDLDTQTLTTTMMNSRTMNTMELGEPKRRLLQPTTDESNILSILKLKNIEEAANKAGPWLQDITDFQNLFWESTALNLEEKPDEPGSKPEMQYKLARQGNKLKAVCQNLARRILHIRNAETGQWQSLFDFNQLKKLRVWCFLLANGIGYGCVFITSMLLPGKVQDLNIEKSEIANLLIMSSAADLIGRIAAGLMGTFLAPFKQLRYRPLWVYQAVLAVGGFVGGIINTDKPFVLYIYVALLMPFQGAFIATTPVAFVDIVGLDSFSRCYGFLLLFQGISFTIFPIILGMLADNSGSFTLSFHAVGSLSSLSSILFAVSTLLQYRENRQKTN